MDKKKVLLIDDEQDFLILMHKIVTSWGYEVFVAAGADEAMEVLRQNRVDALIVDYLMPDTDGVELLRKIRLKGYTAPAIMFTAKPTIKTIEAAKGLYIVAFIPKISQLSDNLEDLRVTLDLICRRT